MHDEKTMLLMLIAVSNAAVHNDVTKVVASH